jgi:hypothetical protein
MNEEAARLRQQASACRRVARAHHSGDVIREYAELARQYELLAIAVEEAERLKETGQVH